MTVTHLLLIGFIVSLLANIFLCLEMCRRDKRHRYNYALAEKSCNKAFKEWGKCLDKLDSYEK